MTPDEIAEAYNVLAQNVNDNAAQEAARIGNAQRSLGTLAERVASPANQTYGLANYTYDRTMRPVVDSTARALATQGLAAGLEQNLTNALRAAKDRYENARNSAYSSGGGSGGTTGTTGNQNYSETTDQAYNQTLDYYDIAREVSQKDGLFAGTTFREDFQAKLKEYYDQGLIDESMWIKWYALSDNEFPSKYSAPYGGAGTLYANGGGGW